MQVISPPARAPSAGISSQTKSGLGGLDLYVPGVGKKIEEMLVARPKTRADKKEEGETGGKRARSAKVTKASRPSSPPALISADAPKKVRACVYLPRPSAETRVVFYCGWRTRWGPMGRPVARDNQVCFWRVNFEWGLLLCPRFPHCRSESWVLCVGWCYSFGIVRLSVYACCGVGLVLYDIVCVGLCVRVCA